MRDLNLWLEAQYAKVCARSPGPVKGLAYQEVPEQARARNNLSGRAAFKSSAIRRRGYLLAVFTEDFITLKPEEVLEAEQEKRWHDAYLRGKVWAPLLCKAEVNAGRWELLSCAEFGLALFLANRQPTIRLQLIEKDDLPGTLGKLELLEQGLFTHSGAHCPVISSRIAY